MFVFSCLFVPLLFAINMQDNDDRSQCGTGENPDTQNQPTHAEMQRLRESLEQQTLQTRQAMAQLVMLRDQLITETNARIEAQVCSLWAV